MLTGWRNGWINYLYRFSRNSAFWKKNGFHAYNSPCDFILNCTEPFFEKIHFLVFCCSAAAAAAKLLQSCPTLCDPIDGSPPGSPVPGILQARTLEWAAIFFSSAWKWKVKVKSPSYVRLSDPMDCSPPGSSVHGILQARVLEWGAIAFSALLQYKSYKFYISTR